MLAALLVVPTLMLAPAHADDARWPAGETHRWYLEHTQELPQLLWALGPENADVRLQAVQIRAVVSCAADPSELRSRADQHIVCDFEKVAVAGRGVEGEARQLDIVLNALAARAQSMQWDFELDRDGRIHNPDIVGLDTQNHRDNRFKQLLRLLMASAMAGLEVGPPPGRDRPLPTSPDSVWTQRSPRIVLFPTPTGTSGSFQLRRHTVDADDQLVHTSSWGVGTIAPGATQLTLATYAGDDAWLDKETGRLVHRGWWVVAKPTPSSMVTRTADVAGAAGTSLSGPYGIASWRQGGYLARLDQVDIEPDVGTSGLTGWREGPSTEMLDKADSGHWREQFPRPEDARW